MLAALWGSHPDALRADLQRFYGLNMDGMGTDFTVAHAAACAAHLPRDSACVREIAPEAAWSDDTYLLASIEYDLRVLAWQNSKDGVKGRNQPKRMQTPADIERIKEKTEHTDFRAIAEALGLGGKAVDDG